ncbi:MAG: HAMP domain-containing sensor histidine kinase [Actinomycetota bacterium]
MSLRSQLAITMALLALGVSATMGVLSYNATRNEAISAIDSFLERRFGPFDASDGTDRADSSSPIRGDGDAGPLDETDGARERPPFTAGDSVVNVYDVDGSLVVTSDPDVALPLPELDGDDAIFRTVSVDGERYRLRAQSAPDGTTLVNARSLAESDATLAAVRDRLIVIGIVVTLLAAVLGWFAAVRLARPLGRLSDAARRVAATGELDADLDTAARGEVGEVAGSFSTMLEALRRSRQQQQQLIVDAGHEIKTPLTTLRANADLLASGRLSPEHQERALARISSEVDELTTLTAELLELAAETPVDEPVSSFDVVESAEIAAARAAERFDRPVTVAGPRYRIRGHPSAFDRAVTNLLVNAHKFSPPGSPIEVVVSDVARVDGGFDTTRGSIVVSDRGSGISDDDRDRIFQRFFRSPDARTLPGSGLGLAIVAATAAAHGGKPFVAPNDDGASVGFTFSFSPASDDLPDGV